MNNEMQTGRKAFSTERFVWELQRAFYSFRNGPVLPFFSFRLPLSSWCTPREPEVFTGI